ncbi:MAG: beta-N-acetylglucosaminidase domain-containing protein [Kiritimatiellae bacterium]|nr:beta-N-acetylglucosaminidase domain-containing protein [Kiritimatiellia bacterium]
MTGTKGDLGRRVGLLAGFHNSKAIRLGLWAVVALGMMTPPLFAGGAEKVRERLKTDPFMVPFYTGKILPAPQKVTYTDTFVPLEKTGIILGKGLAENDPRIKLLLNRISQYGGAYEFAPGVGPERGTFIAIGDTALGKALDVPDKPQGYVVKCYRENGRNLVVVNAHDRLGLTWAMNSLIQMITLQGDATVLNAFDAGDWPFVENRGVIGPGTYAPYGEGSKIYPTLTKLNRFMFTISMMVPRRAAPPDWMNWRKPRPEAVLRDIAMIGDNFRGLDIEWSAWLTPMAMRVGHDTAETALNCGSDVDFDIIWKMCEPVLKAGGGICYGPDDFRYPIHPEDAKRFGSAREADIFFVNRFYNKVKGAYPRAIVSQIGPFYWGPTGQNPWSDESSTEYLKAQGERTPKDIEIFWTGPGVKSGSFSAADVKKYADLIKRKPSFSQNASDCVHNFYYLYPTDRIRWWLGKGRDKEVYLELGGASLNSMGLYADTLWAAMLWNPDGYDDAEAAYQATCKLVGPENYPALKKLVDEIAWFDQFSDLTQTPFAAGKLAEIEIHLAEAEKLSDACENNTTHPAAAKRWASLSWPLRLTRNFRDALKKNPELRQFAFRGAESEKLAKTEANFDPATDQLFTPYQCAGGFSARKIFGRPATWIRGTQSARSAIKLAFTLEHYPPENACVLLLNGRYGAKGGPPPEIEITLNGERVFKGPAPFSENAWTLREFAILLPAMKRGNALTIRNLEDSGADTPYVALSYAMLRKINADN